MLWLRRRIFSIIDSISLALIRMPVLTGQVSLNHSMLSAYINTGLLHPLELAREAEQRYLDGSARLASVEGYIRQLIGWREYVWAHLLAPHARISAT